MPRLPSKNKATSTNQSKTKTANKTSRKRHHKSNESTRTSTTKRQRANKPPAATSFKLFSQLPPEIRQHIWFLALPAPGSDICTLPETCRVLGRRKLTVRSHYSPLTKTCREARGVAESISPVVRDFNPDSDVLYVSKAAFENFCRMCQERWTNRVRHIAIALPVVESGYWLPRNVGNCGSKLPLGRLPQLETISIVYPKATGTVDFLEDVPAPGRRGPILRKFSARGMRALKVTADYWLDRDYPVKWEKDVKEHLRKVSSVFTYQAKEGGLPVWDRARKRLNMDGGYFEEAQR